MFEVAPLPAIAKKKGKWGKHMNGQSPIKRKGGKNVAYG